MGKRSEVVFGNRMSSQVVKKAENSKERFVKRFGDDSDVDYPIAVVKNPYIGDTLGVSNIVIDGGVSDDIPDGGREKFDRNHSWKYQDGVRTLQNIHGDSVCSESSGIQAILDGSQFLQ